MAPHWFDLVARAALGLGFAPALVTHVVQGLLARS
jgi:hypothetical protein